MESLLNENTEESIWAWGRGTGRAKERESILSSHAYQHTDEEGDLEGFVGENWFKLLSQCFSVDSEVNLWNVSHVDGDCQSKVSKPDLWMLLFRGVVELTLPGCHSAQHLNSPLVMSNLEHMVTKRFWWPCGFQLGSPDGMLGTWHISWLMQVLLCCCEGVTDTPSPPSSGK